MLLHHNDEVPPTAKQRPADSAEQAQGQSLPVRPRARSKGRSASMANLMDLKAFKDRAIQRVRESRTVQKMEKMRQQWKRGSERLRRKLESHLNHMLGRQDPQDEADDPEIAFGGSNWQVIIMSRWLLKGRVRFGCSTTFV